MSIQQSTETDLYVDWQGYHRMIERLALQVYESGWHFDVVLCLARGGLVAGEDSMAGAMDAEAAAKMTVSRPPAPA